MPRLIPESPTFTTGSEKEVWERLRDSLGDDDVLIANLRLTDGDKDHEADLVVLMPEIGVLVLEVKGGVSSSSRTTPRVTSGGPRAVVCEGGSDPWIRRATPSTHSAATSNSTRGAGPTAGWRGGTESSCPTRPFRRSSAFPSCRAGPCTTRPTGRHWPTGSATQRGGCSTAAAHRPTTTSRSSPTS